MQGTNGMEQCVNTGGRVFKFGGEEVNRAPCPPPPPQKSGSIDETPNNRPWDFRGRVGLGVESLA